MKGHRRHVFFYKILRKLSVPLFNAQMGFSCRKAPELQAPYIVVSNHNTDLDPALVWQSFPQQMYYVASEHVLRGGFFAWLLKFTSAPIAKIKGSSDAASVKTMLQRLKDNMNICIFAEGNRSFDGVTCPIPPATGKMIKSSGATLVTYKLTGGYFTSPRWSMKMRRGKMFGSCVNVYPPQSLARMTPQQINKLVADDIFEDAYATQRVENIQFNLDAINITMDFFKVDVVTVICYAITET